MLTEPQDSTSLKANDEVSEDILDKMASSGIHQFDMIYTNDLDHGSYISDTIKKCLYLSFETQSWTLIYAKKKRYELEYTVHPQGQATLMRRRFKMSLFSSIIKYKSSLFKFDIRCKSGTIE